MSHSFQKEFNITQEESIQIAKLLCLPQSFFCMGYKLNIEFDCWKGYPGDWDNPPEPPEVYVTEVSLIEFKECELHFWQLVRIGGLLLKLKADELETLCFEEMEYQNKLWEGKNEDYWDAKIEQYKDSLESDNF